jgi:crotonobetainyl-CoA:carnitine CoA-transferase CaiB-like acyl-CoA transferase
MGMTKDEIIDMAKQAWISDKEAQLITEFDEAYLSCTYLTDLTEFAKLVAAKEREECAEICKKHADVYGAFEPTPSFQAAWAACIDLRDVIRARGGV